MSKPEYLRSDAQKRRSKTEYLVIAVLVVLLLGGSFLWNAVTHKTPSTEADTARGVATMEPLAPRPPAAQPGVQPKPAKPPAPN